MIAWLKVRLEAIAFAMVFYLAYPNSVMRLLFAIVIVLHVLPYYQVQDLDDHFKKYAAINETHHDNIDDAHDVHSHVHRHSEEEQEHEHKHDHAYIVQIDLKTIYSPVYVVILCPDDRGVSEFREDRLFSDPHPMGVFRPPQFSAII